MFRNSDLISHAIYPQQVKRRASVTAEGFLVELGREKEGLRGIPHPISIALETGVRPQQGRCSRDTERFILSPGRWQGVPAPLPLQVTGRRALKRPREA